MPEFCFFEIAQSPRILRGIKTFTSGRNFCMNLFVLHVWQCTPVSPLAYKLERKALAIITYTSTYNMYSGIYMYIILYLLREKERERETMKRNNLDKRLWNLNKVNSLFLFVTVSHGPSLLYK